MDLRSQLEIGAIVIGAIISLILVAGAHGKVSAKESAPDPFEDDMQLDPNFWIEPSELPAASDPEPAPVVTPRAKRKAPAKKSAAKKSTAKKTPATRAKKKTS
jgi:hypothetical protein